jgi:hypothetical protein
MKHSITRALSIVAITLSAALAAIGCRGGGEGPDCKAAAAAYASLLQDELEKSYTAANAAGAPEAASADKKKALSLIPLAKESIAKECTEKKWDREARRCIADARTADDLERCQVRKPTELGEPAGGEAPAPAAGEAPAREPAPQAPAATPQAPATTGNSESK